MSLKIHFCTVIWIFSEKIRSSKVRPMRETSPGHQDNRNTILETLGPSMIGDYCWFLKKENSTEQK